MPELLHALDGSLDRCHSSRPMETLSRLPCVPESFSLFLVENRYRSRVSSIVKEREKEIERGKMRLFWSSSSSLVLLVPLMVVVLVFSAVDPNNSWLASKLSWRYSPLPSSSSSSSLSKSSVKYSSPPPAALHARARIAPEAQPPLSSFLVALSPSPLALHATEESPLQGSTPVFFNSSLSSSVPPPTSAIAPLASELAAQEEDANLDKVEIRRKRRFSKLGKTEAALARARTAIREAALYGNQTSIKDADYTPWGPIYRNPSKFHRSYVEMEKVFKIYVYKEGEPPLVHDGPCRSIYSTEGRFIHEMDKGNRFVTKDAEEAHAFFLPFSIVKMVRFIYNRHRRDAKPIKRFVADYIDVVSKKYGYWERNLGADHFMVSCHDWGPMASTANSHLYHNSIRVLCNANTSEGFNPSKDAALPEINMKTDKLSRMIGGPSPSRRPILAFFAGGVHGPIRPVLLEHWKDKDDDVRVYEYLPKNLNYYDLMRKSKYCLCPSGYEVASPRIVEAIYLECVPVTISEGFVPPFSDVLNWNSFSVNVPLSEIGNLKKILMGISTRRYLTMHRRVKLVRRHFMVNSPPKRYDLFHMILHSVWLRRLNQRPRLDFQELER